MPHQIKPLLTQKTSQSELSDNSILIQKENILFKSLDNMASTDAIF